MRKHIPIIALVMAFGLFAANTGMAQTDTHDLVVTATVGEFCRINSVTNIDFKAYDPFGTADLDAAGDIRFQCVADTAYDVYITGNRAMASATSGDSLNFELYTDSGRTHAFPNANPGTPATAGDSAEITVDVYGRIPASQMVGVGPDYTTTLTATIEY